MFYRALEHLHRWERKQLPGADTPQGREVLVWLLKSQKQPRPLKDLYRSSRYSEPTIRTWLKVFVDKGFVVIESDGQDMRTRVAHVTPKFEAAMKAYQGLFLEVAALSERERGATGRLPPSGRPSPFPLAVLGERQPIS
jgi:DNA-binding MarR family transcriptional regulator